MVIYIYIYNLFLCGWKFISGYQWINSDNTCNVTCCQSIWSDPRRQVIFLYEDIKLVLENKGWGSELS